MAFAPLGRSVEVGSGCTYEADRFKQLGGFGVFRMPIKLSMQSIVITLCSIKIIYEHRMKIRLA